MSIDSEGGAAGAPVTRFAGALLDILDRVEYSRVSTDSVDHPIYRLRYEAYRREESVPLNDAGIVADDLDGVANAMSFGVHIDGELVSSVRLHHLSKEQPYSPSMTVYPEILGPLLERGQTFIDPSRFTADYEASLAYPALPFLTLRIAVMASMHFDADCCLALVRPEHAAFYRRIFGSEEMGGQRAYPGLAFPVKLYGAYVDTKLPTTLRRYPFFHSAEEERGKLFGPGGDGATAVAPTARLAQRLATLDSEMA